MVPVDCASLVVGCWRSPSKIWNHLSVTPGWWYSWNGALGLRKALITSLPILALPLFWQPFGWVGGSVLSRYAHRWCSLDSICQLLGHFLHQTACTGRHSIGYRPRLHVTFVSVCLETYREIQNGHEHSSHLSTGYWSGGPGELGIFVLHTVFMLSEGLSGWLFSLTWFHGNNYVTCKCP